MRESATYQAILEEGRAEGEARGEAKGLAEGKAEGKAEAANQIAINLLSSGAAVDFIAKVTGLSLDQIQQLQQQSRENTRTSD